MKAPFRLLIALCLLIPITVLAQSEDAQTLTYGQSVTGVISDAQPEIRYRFDGQAGDVISIQMTATVIGLDSYLVLITPDGERLIDDDGAGNLNSLLGPVVLQATGSYTILATRCCDGMGSSVGSYSLLLNRVELQPIALDQTLTLSLTQASPAAFISLDATMDGPLLGAVEAQIISGPGTVNLLLRTPEDTPYFGSFIADGSASAVDLFPLTPPGTYLLRVTRQPDISPMGEPINSTEATEIRVAARTVNPEPIQAGMPTSGALSDEAPARYLSVSARAGDLFSLDMIQDLTAAPFEFTIYDPEFNIINGGLTAYSEGRVFIDPLILDREGTYLLVLRRAQIDGSGITGTISRFTVTLGASTVRTLSPGETVQDTVGEMQIERVFRIDGQAGQTLRFTLSSLDDSYAPSLDVQGPAPAEDDFYGPRSLFNVYASTPGTFTYSLTLPTDGTYLVRVYNGLVSEGQFEISLTAGD